MHQQVSLQSGYFCEMKIQIKVSICFYLLIEIYLLGISIERYNFTLLTKILKKSCLLLIKLKKS